MRAPAVCLLACALAALPLALGWGSTGHHVVGAIAMRYMTPVALKEANRLLGAWSAEPPQRSEYHDAVAEAPPCAAALQNASWPTESAIDRCGWVGRSEGRRLALEPAGSLPPRSACTWMDSIRSESSLYSTWVRPWETRFCGPASCPPRQHRALAIAGRPPQRRLEALPSASASVPRSRRSPSRPPRLRDGLAAALL